MSSGDRSKQLNDLFNTFADPFKDNGVVYHYTSVEGLKGIVESREIWLTNTAFVNDTTECRAFWDLPKDKVLGADPFPKKGYAEKCWEDHHRRPWRKSDHYIASFSESRDSLAQFRMYGNFCIGFDANRLTKQGFNLYRCMYSDEEIKTWIQEKFSVEQWNGDSLDDQGRRMAAFTVLFAASIKYKNRHYREEQEVRLSSGSTTDLRDGNVRLFTEDQPPVHFRDHHRYGLPVPYLKFFLTDHQDEESRSNLAFEETPAETRNRRLAKERDQPRDLLPITEVRIGPMMHQKEARIACEILLQTAGYEHVKVEAPDIPYRGW